MEEFRAPVYCPNLIPFLRALKPRVNPIEECYPFAAVKFGIGYIILSGFKPYTQGSSEKISTALLNSRSTLMNRGTLDDNLD